MATQATKLIFSFLWEKKTQTNFFGFLSGDLFVSLNNYTPKTKTKKNKREENSLSLSTRCSRSLCSAPLPHSLSFSFCVIEESLLVAQIAKRRICLGSAFGGVSFLSSILSRLTSPSSFTKFQMLATPSIIYKWTSLET